MLEENFDAFCKRNHKGKPSKSDEKLKKKLKILNFDPASDIRLVRTPVNCLSYKIGDKA